MKKRNCHELLLFMAMFGGCVNAAQPMLGGWDPVKDQQPPVTRQLWTHDDLAAEVQERASKFFDERLGSGEQDDQFAQCIKAVVDKFPYFSFENALMPTVQFSLESYLESLPAQHKIILKDRGGEAVYCALVAQLAKRNIYAPEDLVIERPYQTPGKVLMGVLLVAGSSCAIM
jgi:hypothetical protein